MAEKGSKKVKVLLAEDEAPLRELLLKILERHRDRYDLMVAKDGQEALHAAQQYEGVIELLISNVQMPGMTGPDLARELRKSRPDMKIMLMSGYSQGLLILDNGWNFLQKPFLPQAILDKIEAILAERETGDTHSG